MFLYTSIEANSNLALYLGAVMHMDSFWQTKDTVEARIRNANLTPRDDMDITEWGKAACQQSSSKRS